MNALHVFLACDEENQKAFPNVPVIGFKNSKTLGWHLVSAAYPIADNVRSKSCGTKRPLFQLCSSSKDTDSFKNKHFEEVHHIT